MRGLRPWMALMGCFALAVTAPAEPTTYRLYDGITAFVDNPEGKAFTVSLDVRDINHRMHGPSEMLVKVYPPDGRPVVREIIADDGIVAPSAAPSAAGWDHEAWYYATCYSRGLEPLVRWSTFSNPSRLSVVPSRTFTYEIEGGQKGVYRVLLVGAPDHYVTLGIDPDLAYSVAGSPEWLHGHHDLHARKHIYVPRATKTINILFLQYDEPAERSFSLKAPDGTVLASGNGADGLVRVAVECEGARDEQVLELQVTDGPGDYLVNVTFQIDNEFRPVRAPHQAVTALFSPDEKTARATQGGAIYHDGKVFWQMHQVRLHDWLAKLSPADFEYPRELIDTTGFMSVGSHNSPSFASDKKRAVATSDLIMYRWDKHKNPQALNAAIKDVLFGQRLMSHGDHVAIGPLRNLAYEMGCYTFFWYRPAWRVMQQPETPQEVKDILREFVIQAGDRLAFARTVSTVNGNSFASLMAGVRYCCEASQDPLQKEVFDTIWERFTTGGYGDRVGIGPSGGLQESFAYDFHYGSYVLRGWKAVVADLQDPRMIEARNRIENWFSYVWFQGPGGNQWGSRTSADKTCGGSYDAWSRPHVWKGFGGPNLTEGVGGYNEWFAARREGYYMLTYHGRLSPSWLGEGFQGQVGLGGGGICQLHVIGHGQVLSSKPNGSYGGGMHLSQWRNFHVHGIVGTTTDDKPLVSANSEHPNAKLEGTTVTSSGLVRQSSVSVSRKYEYGPGAIACEVSLAEAHHDNAFGLWGGRPALRGKVTEAFEMIPFVDAPTPKGKPRGDRNRTKVSLLGADGAPIGDLTDDSVGKPAVGAAGVLIDLGGYGALIQFDELRPVARGQNDTLLIRLAEGRVPASDVALGYHIVPFAGTPPTLGEMTGSGREEHLLARLEAPVSADTVKALLADIEPRDVMDKSQVLGRLRIATAGTDLVVHATVFDGEVVHHATVWKGSDIEIFGSRPDSLAIGQVFLAPAADDKPATGYRADGGKQVPTPEIRVWSETTAQGYEISALVPLTLLKLDPAEGRFMMEFQVSSKTGKTRIYRTLFGSKYAYENNQVYGLFVFEKSPPPEETQ